MCVWSTSVALVAKVFGAEDARVRDGGFRTAGAERFVASQREEEPQGEEPPTLPAPSPVASPQAAPQEEAPLGEASSPAPKASPEKSAPERRLSVASKMARLDSQAALLELDKAERLEARKAVLTEGDEDDGATKDAPGPEARPVVYDSLTC